MVEGIDGLAETGATEHEDDDNLSDHVKDDVAEHGLEGVLLVDEEVEEEELCAEELKNGELDVDELEERQLDDEEVEDGKVDVEELEDGKLDDEEFEDETCGRRRIFFFTFLSFCCRTILWLLLCFSFVFVPSRCEQNKTGGLSLTG